MQDAGLSKYNATRMVLQWIDAVAEWEKRKSIVDAAVASGIARSHITRFPFRAYFLN